MGAGKNRKKKDRPSIKPPENTSGIENKSVGGVGGMQDLCVASFDAKVNQTDFTAVGATAQLLKIDKNYIVVVQNERVGVLSQKEASMVEQCGQLGIKYIGNLINKKGGVYARFLRTS